MGTSCALRSAARFPLYLRFESHIPDRSGFPSAVRGAGAVRFGLPSSVRGTLGSRGFAHWASPVEAMSRRIPVRPKTRQTFIVRVYTRQLALSRRIVPRYELLPCGRIRIVG